MCFVLLGIAKLLRTVEGMVIGNTVVNAEMIIRHLSRDPSRTTASIDLLMNPADAQDVPRAIDLIEAVNSIGLLSTSSCSPSEIHEVALIRVIGNTFSSFLHAFIKPDWSLIEQITSLSKYSHVCFILFRQHRVNFTPCLGIEVIRLLCPIHL